MGVTFLERWKRLSLWQRRLALFGALTALVAVIELVGLRPLRRQLTRTRHDVQDMEHQLTRAILLSSRAHAIEQAYDAYRPFVPSEDATANLRDPVRLQNQVQSEIESDARAIGMNVLTVRPTADTSAPDRLMVAMEVEATPSQLIQWLDHVRRSPSLLSVNRLAIRVPEESAGLLRCSMVVTKLLLGVAAK